MPLILGIREGSDFYVGHNRLKIMKIHSATCFDVQSGTPGHLKITKVTDEKSVEVYPQVRLSAGLHGSNVLARVVIDAPISMKILRGKIYKKEHQ